MADFETGLKLLQDIHQKEITKYLKEISVIKSKLKHCESQLAQAHKDNAGLARKFDETKVKLVGKRQETMHLRELLLRKDVSSRAIANNSTLDSGVPPKPLFLPVTSNALDSIGLFNISGGDGTLSLSPVNDNGLKVHMNMTWNKPQPVVDVSQFNRKPLKLKKKFQLETKDNHCLKPKEELTVCLNKNVSDNVNQSTGHPLSVKSTFETSIGTKADATCTLSNSSSNQDDPCESGIGDETRAVDLCPVDDDSSSSGSLDECYAHSPSLLSSSDTITSPTSCVENSKRKRKILQTTLTQAFTCSNKKLVDLNIGCESPGEAESPVITEDNIIPPTPWIRPSRGSLADDWSRHSDDGMDITRAFIHVDEPKEFNNDNVIFVPEVSETAKIEKSVSDTEVNKPIKPLTYAQQLASKAGLPMYEHVTVMRKKDDRAKLDGKACKECAKWYKNNDIYKDNVDHLRQTCRHKRLFHPPESDPGLWSISFPD